MIWDCLPKFQKKKFHSLQKSTEISDFHKNMTTYIRSVDQQFIFLFSKAISNPI